MKLLNSTDYALRLLMLLATQPPERPLSVATLAKELGGLSRNHLHKVVQDLAGLGVVRTVRGVGGGVQLGAAPSEIRVGTLIRQLEGDQPVVECFRVDGGSCTLVPVCRLRGFVGRARQDFYDSLDGHTIADCLPPGHLQGGSIGRPTRRATSIIEGHCSN
jgi:Rrf2 family nitric oxide-sensitive transcriptional repressor